MAVDYLSTLNSKGSGINITQLVDSLVSAEIDPAKNIVKAKLDKGNVAISEMATIRSELATFSEVLNSPNAGLAIYADSTDDYIQISVDDPDIFTPFSSKISVNQLAAEQVLAFTSISDTDITSTSDELNGGAAETFTISFGTWSSSGFAANADATDLTLEMDAGSTISDLVASLSDLDGVTARLIDNGDDTYTLAVISESGEENAIYISSSSGDFDTVASDDDGLPSQQVTAATDAELEVDGITVTRTSNEITDLFDGTTVTISGITTSSATVSALEDSDIALAEMNAFIGYINANRSMLNIATARGINGATPGPFAGDVTMNAIKSQLSAITTNPIDGFLSGSFYLSDLGVLTNQDGTLSLDEDTFTAAFDEDSTRYKAIFRSKIETDSSLLSASATDFSNLTAGNYSISYDSENDELTVNDETFVTYVSSDDYTNYYASYGDFSGVSLKSSTGVGASSNLYVGISLTSTIMDYLDDLLSSSGDFTERETTIEEDLADYEIKIASFDDKAVTIRSRYTSQFIAMEQMVTKFKATGEYLTTMMDSWVNQK
jgi:flagellar hook-associated protein 2